MLLLALLSEEMQQCLLQVSCFGVTQLREIKDQFKKGTVKRQSIRND